MDPPNQVPEPEHDPEDARVGPAPEVAGAEPLGQPTRDVAAPTPIPPAVGLATWLIITVIAGVGGLLLQQAELGMFTALAGLFAVAHAADLDRERELVYRLLAWVVPAFGALLFVGLGVVLLTGGTWTTSGGALQISRIAQGLGVAVSAIGALLTVFLAHPASAGTVGCWWFRTSDTSHVLRLATRISILGALFYIPASIAFAGMLDDFASSGQDLVGRGSLWGNLIGLTLLALGGIGFRVRRNLRETLVRLGLDAITPAHWLVVVIGVVAMMTVNTGAEWVQKTWLPALWNSDQAVTHLITRGLSHYDAVLLGISAGVGEELVIRGALQPRLGVVRTAGVFSLLHVQYSWFGVVVIFLLGVLLGTIRRRTSTTVAVLVHTLYDTLAVILSPA